MLRVVFDDALVVLGGLTSSLAESRHPSSATDAAAAGVT